MFPNLMNQMNNNMGMNQMGMNQMGMNQMGMNQMNNNMGMNPMNFNNQIIMNNLCNMPMGNILDDNSLKIKNIVKPYEDKIKELEEKLRQKEFEIACLKNKLNENNIMIPIQMNQMDQMNMNLMNQVNQMNQMGFMMNMANDQELITLLFEEKGKSSQKIKCTFDELNISVINKYCRNNFIVKDDFKFIFNGKKINENLTVGESGLMNNSKINVINKNISDKNNSNNYSDDKTPKKNIVFATTSGIKINIRCNFNETVGDAIKKYLKRMNISENYFKDEKLTFLFEGRKLNKDNTKIGIKFILKHAPQINVLDTHNLKGGNNFIL